VYEPWSPKIYKCCIGAYVAHALSGAVFLIINPKENDFVYSIIYSTKSLENNAFMLYWLEKFNIIVYNVYIIRNLFTQI